MKISKYSILILLAVSAACRNEVVDAVSCDVVDISQSVFAHTCMESYGVTAYQAMGFENMCTNDAGISDSNPEPTYTFSQVRCVRRGRIAGCRKLHSEGYNITTWYYVTDGMADLTMVQMICSRLGGDLVLP